MIAVAGVDGCRAGWLVVTGPPFRFGEARASIVAAPDDEGLAALVIDMPVGLTDRQTVPRPTDGAARAFLRERNLDGHASPGSRVFAAPSRAALALFRAGLSQAGMNAALDGPKLTAQAFNITGRIDRLDRWMTPERQSVVREGHPEVAFALLTGRTLPPKKTPPGAALREAALAGLGFDLPALAAGLGPRTGRWAMDDLRDACVLAWAAARVAAGQHRSFPAEPEQDARGLRMEIVA